MSWTLVHEMNETKMTRQICNIPLFKYMGNEKNFFLSAAIVLSYYCLENTEVIKVI